MSNYLVSDTDMTSVADAIRTKGGTSASLAFPTGFVDAIGAIQSGGGATMVKVYTGQASGYSVLPSGATEEMDYETYDTYINIANDSMFIGQTQSHEAETSGTVTATLLYSKQSGPFTTYYYAVLPGSSGGNFF